VVAVAVEEVVVVVVVVKVLLPKRSLSVPEGARVNPRGFQVS